MDGSYKKNDYLSAKQYSICYKIPFESVKSAMEFAYKRHLIVKIGPLSRELVFKLNHRNEYHLRPEPQAQQKFESILQRFITKTKKGK